MRSSWGWAVGRALSLCRPRGDEPGQLGPLSGVPGCACCILLGPVCSMQVDGGQDGRLGPRFLSFLLPYQPFPSLSPEKQKVFKSIWIWERKSAS